MLVDPYPTDQANTLPPTAGANVLKVKRHNFRSSSVYHTDTLPTTAGASVLKIEGKTLGHQVLHTGKFRTCFYFALLVL